MTGTDLIQIGSGLGAGIAGTLIAVIKWMERKAPEKPVGNGLSLKDYQAGVDRVIDRLDHVIAAIREMKIDHSENMQQLAGNVARDVKIIVLEHVKP